MANKNGYIKRKQYKPEALLLHSLRVAIRLQAAKKRIRIH